MRNAHEDRKRQIGVGFGGTVCSHELFVMKFLIGRKFEMTQVFADDGKVTPVTLVKVEPCTVTAVNTLEKRGYTGVQLSCELKERPTKKHPEREDYRVKREFRCDEETLKGVEVGATLDESVFSVGDPVMVRGTSKGKGFQGVVKRHGFSGSPKTHGHKDQLRMPGSIGASSTPSRVLKGKRMGGRMGGKGASSLGVKVVAVDPVQHTIAVQGSIPGARRSIVTIAFKN